MAATIFPAASSGGLQPYEQVFTSSGTWTKPNGVKTVEVTLVGAGGGGSTYGFGGPGGVIKRTLDVSNITSATVTVGAGGAATKSGGSTIFNNQLVAIGGEGATNGLNTNFEAAGANGWTDLSETGVNYLQLSSNTTAYSIFNQAANVIYYGHIAGNTNKFAFFQTGSGSSTWEWKNLSNPSATYTTVTTRTFAGRDGQRPVWDNNRIYFDGASNSTTGSCFFTYSSSGLGSRVDFNKPEAGFFGSINGVLYLAPQQPVAQVRKSIDNGTTWTTETATFSGPITTFNSNASFNGCYSDGSIIVGATPYGVFATANGTSWVSANPGWSSSNVYHHVARIGLTRYIAYQHDGSTLSYRVYEIPTNASSISQVATGSTSVGTASVFNIPGTSSLGPYTIRPTNGTWVVAIAELNKGGSFVQSLGLLTDYANMAKPYQYFQNIISDFDYQTGWMIHSIGYGGQSFGFAASRGYKSYENFQKALLGQYYKTRASHGAGTPVSVSSSLVQTNEFFWFQAGLPKESYAGGIFSFTARDINPNNSTFGQPGAGDPNISGFPGQNGLAILRWWA